MDEFSELPKKKLRHRVAQEAALPKFLGVLCNAQLQDRLNELRLTRLESARKTLGLPKTNAEIQSYDNRQIISPQPHQRPGLYPD
jgi:hypothetical protein